MKRFYHIVLFFFISVLAMSAAGLIFTGCATGKGTGAVVPTDEAGPAGPDIPAAFSLDVYPQQSSEIPHVLPLPFVDLKALLKETVAYTVTPSPRQQDAYGYIEVIYRTAEEVVLAKAKDTGADVNDEKAMERLKDSTPAGGIIEIGINRKDLLHANTKWYSYVLQFGGDRNDVKRKGAESIPYVKGRDNLWWNSDEMPVAIPLENSLTLCVDDAKIGKRYCFTVTRTVTYEELSY